MTPDVLEGLPENIVKQFRLLEERVMLDVVRRLKNNGNDIIRSADWQLYRLQELGMTESEIRQYIKDALGVTDEELDGIYNKVIEDGFSYDDSIYKGLDVTDKDSFVQLAEGIRQQTDDEFSNITQTTGFAIDKNGKISYSSVTDVLDGAMLDISSGLFDYNTVLKRVVNEMTNSGLRTIDYASGWSNRVDVAVRRAIMTGVAQLTGKINESNAEKLGTETFEVSWHSGARPAHLEWQGKWYTKDELVSVCGLGTVTGLLGANCYHSYSPVIPGISKPTYTAEQLERMKREELTPKEYGGKKYTKYEALQKQRRMETTMRAQRQKIKLLEEGGADEDDIINARCRYRGTSAEYARFSKAMDLPQQRERVYIDGLGDIGVGKWKLKNETEIRSKDDYKNIEKTKVNWTAIKSEKWRSNIYQITDNKNVNNTLENVSEQLLKQRDGTFYESMYLINAKTGNIEGFNTTSNVKLKVALNDNMKKALDNPGLELIGIHNHPYSSIPSLADLNAIAKRGNQAMGVIICHDGTIFTYTRPKCTIRKQDYDTSLTRYRIYSKITNEDKGFSDLGEDYGFIFRRYEVEQ